MVSSSEHPLQKLLEALPNTPVLSALGLTPEIVSRILARPVAEDTTEESVVYLDPAVAPIGHTRPPTRMVTRTFGFLDMVSFTETVAALDADEVTALMSVFRALVREVAAARGCRIDKWLGDGVFIVGVDNAPVAATLAEITVRLAEADIAVASGLARGEVLQFLGEDYIGSSVNLSSRLSDLAKPGQLLAAGDALHDLPDWITPGKPFTTKLKGLGRQTIYPLSFSHE